MAAQVTQRDAIALRVGAAALRTCIERLEAAPRAYQGLEQRRSPRYAYRVTSLVLELYRDQTVASRYVVAARNLSREGIAVVAQQFIYPRQACRIELTPVGGRPQSIDGVVARCRYLPGQGGLHDVGIQFRLPIDVPLFIPAARPIRVLLADPDPQAHQLVDGFLGENVELTCATCAVDAGAAALSREFDLMLVDLDAESIDAFRLMRELRRAGYLGAIIGMTAESGEALAARCSEAGCTGYLSRPVTREALLGLLESLRTEPLLSTLQDDARLAPLVDEYIRSIRDQAKALVVALENGDLATIQRVARALRSSAGSYGFPSISAEATLVESLAAIKSDAAELRGAVAELVHLCLRARSAPVGGGACLPGD